MNPPGIAKKSLVKKIALWSAGLFVLVGVIGFLVAPYFVKSALEKSIGEKLHRTATIRELGINPYALSATVKGFALKEKDGKNDALSFDELYVNVEAASLLRLAPVIGKIHLIGPHVNVVRNADLSYNYTDVIEEFLNQPGTGQKSQFSISHIKVSGGRIDFDDRPKNKRHAVSDIELNVPFVSNLPSKVDVDMQPAFSAKVNEAAIAEKHPSATRLNNIIHPQPERDFLVLYHEDEADDATNSNPFRTKLSAAAELPEARRDAA